MLTIELAGVEDNLFDRLEIAGDAALDGALAVELLDTFVPNAGDSFEILDVTSTLSGEFLGLAEGALIDVGADLPLQLSYIGGDGNDVILTTVPEPGAFVLLLLAGSIATQRRGRCRATKI